MANKQVDLWRNRWAQPFRDFDQMFEDFLARRSGDATALAPNFELSESTDSYIAKFDIPGIKKEDVHIDVAGDQLTVQAERSEEKKSDDDRKHYSEVSYGSYMRSFTLPGAVDQGKIEAKLDNGVLTVRLPKSKAAASKKIDIQ